MMNTLSTVFAASLLTVAGVGRAQTTRFIAVEPNVKLEVLDWGGTGRSIVLLAGNTLTAHSFYQFAPALTPDYHVVGITRRGFGASSKPETGYDADRLADDVLAVIDSLHLTMPVLAGHSLAGQELSSIGSRHPEKVAGLVYLDAAYAYAFYSVGNFETDANELRRSLERFKIAGSKGDVAEVRRQLERILETDLPMLEQSLRTVQAATPRVDKSSPLMPPPAVGMSRLMYEGEHRYTKVHVPVLAIYAGQGLGADTDSATAAAWIAQRVPASQVLERNVPGARIVVLPGATHAVFDSNQADVLREMHAFIESLPVAHPPRP